MSDLSLSRPRPTTWFDALLRAVVVVLAITGLVMLVTALFPSFAFAATDTSLEDSQTDVFNLSPLAVSTLLGVIVPILTGLITKAQASPKLKAVVNLTLSAIAAVVTSSLVDNGGAVLSSETLVLAGLTWVVSIATYFGLYKPTGTTQAVQAKTAQFGLGSNTGD